LLRHAWHTHKIEPSYCPNKDTHFYSLHEQRADSNIDSLKVKRLVSLKIKKKAAQFCQSIYTARIEFFKNSRLTQKIIIKSSQKNNAD
jgi:hypothetical protein